MFAMLMLFALAAAPPKAAPEPSGHDATMHHRFEDPSEWVKVFDAPDRDRWQKPDAVLAAVGVVPGMTVADLGAGTGYFSVRLGRAVGAAGQVLALDVEPKLVEYMKARAQREKLPQMKAVLVPPDDPKLPEHGVDLVLIVDTWHHLDDRLHYLGKIARGLSARGRVAVIDFKKGELPVGPPDAHKLAPDAVAAELTEAGWTVTGRDESLLPYQYILIASPKQTAKAP